MRRECPKCNDRTIQVSLIRSYFSCEKCSSTFYIPSWVKWLEVFIAAFLGSAFVYILIFWFSWFAAFLVFFVVPFVLNGIIKMYCPLKIGDV
jgi:hypothetical protein